MESLGTCFVFANNLVASDNVQISLIYAFYRYNELRASTFYNERIHSIESCTALICGGRCTINSTYRIGVKTSKVAKAR